MENVQIPCRCKDCDYSEKRFKDLYCYYWDYEPGCSPNEVDPDGFCYHATPKK